MKVSDARKGMVIRIDGDFYLITKYVHTTPGKGQAVHHVYLKNILSGRQKELRMSTGDSIEDVYPEKRSCQYLYRDANGHVFMDNESYEQFHLPDSMVAETLRFIQEGDNTTVMFIDNEPRLIELDVSVVLEVTEAEEAARGDTATSVQKNVTVVTGYTLKAPGHIKVGDKLKITTEDGLYSSRAND